MALTAYLTATQNLLGTGGAGNLYSTTALTAYINTARSQIAAEGQCIRALPPVSGPLSTVTILSGGTGWGNVTVLVSSPDFPPGFLPYPNGLQAVATATTGAAGAITAVTVLTGGAGYFSPVVSFSGAGHSTFALATVSGVNATVVNQEVYPFSNVNSLVALSGSGISSIYMVNSISLIWGTFRYTLMRMSFSKYQALARTYTAGYTYIPAVFSQFGQGVAGSVYVYPIPNSPYQMEWDCCCLPAPLNTDTDPEALPYPWTDAVPFLACYYAFSGAQRFADADRMWKEFEKYTKRARQMSNPRGTVNWYGRG